MTQHSSVQCVGLESSLSLSVMKQCRRWWRGYLATLTASLCIDKKRAILMCFGRRSWSSVINLNECCCFLYLMPSLFVNMWSCDWRPTSVQHHLSAVRRAGDCWKFSSQSLLLFQLSQTNCKHAPALVNERCPAISEGSSIIQPCSKCLQWNWFRGNVGHPINSPPKLPLRLKSSSHLWARRRPRLHTNPSSHTKFQNSISIFSL